MTTGIVVAAPFGVEHAHVLVYRNDKGSSDLTSRCRRGGVARRRAHDRVVEDTPWAPQRGAPGSRGATRGPIAPSGAAPPRASARAGGGGSAPALGFGGASAASAGGGGGGGRRRRAQDVLKGLLSWTRFACRCGRGATSAQVRSRTAAWSLWRCSWTAVPRVRRRAPPGTRRSRAARRSARPSELDRAWRGRRAAARGGTPLQAGDAVQHLVSPGNLSSYRPRTPTPHRRRKCHRTRLLPKRVPPVQLVPAF